MSDSHPESGSVIDLGGVALPPSGETGPAPFDYPFTHDSEVFFRGVLDGIINTGGMPRLLFVGRGGLGNGAGIAALGLAKAAAQKRVDVLVVDASFDGPSLAKPFPYQPDEGLADMILWGSSLQATLRKTQNERIQIVSAGSPPADPDNILLDHDSDSVLNTLREQAELVLVVSDLRNGVGELSPLVRRSDRTLIVRGEDDPVVPINETLPEGKVLEITIGNLAAVEDPIDEAALLAAAAADAAKTAQADAANAASAEEAAPSEPRDTESKTSQTPPSAPKPSPTVAAGMELEPANKNEASPAPTGAGAPSQSKATSGKRDAGRPSNGNEQKKRGPREKKPATLAAAAGARGTAGSDVVAPKPSPVAPDPSVGQAVPAYDASKEKKEGSLLGIVGALAGVAAVIGVVGGFWFLQGRFQGVNSAASPRPETVAQKEVPVPADRGALDANGSGAVNQPADASGAEQDGAGAGGKPEVAVASGDGADKRPDPASTASGGSRQEVARDRTIPIRTGKKVTPAAKEDAPVKAAATKTDAPALSSETASAPPESKPASTVSGRVYGVHVESFPTRKEADDVARGYEAAGMPVTIKAVNVPAKGLWHRVILGRVGSKAEADALSREIKERFDLRYTLVVRVDR